MNDALYEALDANTRRRYDRNLQRQNQKYEEERQQRLHEKEQCDYNVRIAFIYLAMIGFVGFLLVYFWSWDAKHLTAALFAPFFIAFLGVFFTMY